MLLTLQIRRMQVQQVKVVSCFLGLDDKGCRAQQTCYELKQHIDMKNEVGVRFARYASEQKKD